jgi:hypothetical protein
MIQPSMDWSERVAAQPGSGSELFEIAEVVAFKPHCG